ncbi:HMA2 domain-containing protein [Crocosphaera chwakensis]|uniref:Cd/Co/Hg/Pb/Zn-translocating P-type ATPase n=1 Tax=Crocosphaera chwakensis CCY0110 TaxID=391612 RepID=A3ILN0_9CHRO|nr:Cd/Co/Hg/Pb/Zn-translocating P-type ATPase [Crocosphaera chwakensis]EAZ92681.1 Cd/Co/Hg/Pb/Zn-translocating P-type ATPase [Crocosphaera chwakensis CCY0110]
MIDNALGAVTNEQDHNQTIGEQIGATEEQLLNYLRQHNEIEMIVPVLIGVFVTSRFQLRGANALLVNLAVASLCRHVFTTIKSQNLTTQRTEVTNGRMNSTDESESEYQIVHSVPGRIRIKVPQLGEDADFARRLQQLLNDDDSVIKVRVNRSAASVIINYDGQGVSDMELGLRLLSILNQAKQTETGTSMI